MSSVVLSVTKRYWESIQDDLLCLVESFLDKTSTARTMAVCKEWQKIIKGSPVFILNLVPRSMGYNREFVETFVSLNLSIVALPILDLNIRKVMGQTDYIHLLPPEHVTHSLMRFADSRGRPGFAFRWRGKADGVIWVNDPKDRRPIREVSGILSVFKCNKNWTCGGQSERLIRAIHETVHAQQHQAPFSFDLCPKCPPFLQKDFVSFFVNLVKGTDPAIEIDTNIPLISPAELSSLEVSSVAEPAARVDEVKDNTLTKRRF